MKENKTEKTNHSSIRRQKQERPHNTAQTRRASAAFPLLHLLGDGPCFVSGPQRVSALPVGTDQEGTRRDGCTILQPGLCLLLVGSLASPASPSHPSNP